MSIIQGNAKRGSVRGFYPNEIEGSLRFNDDDSAYLSWTPASAGNRKTWTWSGWVKRGNLGGIQYIFYAHSGNSDSGNFQFRFESANTILIRLYSNTNVFTTPNVFRDTSSWYHLVLAVDTTQASADDRIKLYVNGSQITKASGSAPSQNSDLAVNDSSALHTIGTSALSVGSSPFDGYMAEVNFIDGTALTADSFGELKNGVWIPKDPSGLTYGTNGFRLSFADDAEVEAFNTVLYRGTGATQQITGVGFQPDLVWVKSRTTASHGALFDSVRGSTGILIPSLTNAESVQADGSIQSFDADGFTLNSDVSTGTSNFSGRNYVAWGWKAGDSNVSNTDGSITSTVRANDTYGFSMVAWDAPSSGATTVGHGLSSAPSWVICKIRNVAANWQTWHTGLTDGTYTLFLNSDIAQQVQADAFGAVPTSSVLNIGSDFSGSGRQNIAYCWAEKSGYSKFGSYEGNNTATGPTVTTTFKPALVIIKNADGTGNWNLFDNTRATFPDNDLFLRANLSAAEVDGSAEGGDAYEVEFTDTGFIPKASGASSRSQVNGTGTYIYAAFADTREAAFWLDQSGNDNDWQPVNLDHNDTVADSPTNNFATWNPLAKLGSVALPTFSDGNLTLTTNASVDTMAVATMGITSGTFYYEATLRSANTYHQFGVASKTDSITTSTDRVTYFGFNGYIYNNATSTSGYGTNSAGDVLGVACDADAGTVKFYRNGTLISTESWTSNTGLYIPFMAGSNGTGYIADVNFGQQPFKYDPPA